MSEYGSYTAQDKLDNTEAWKSYNRTYQREWKAKNRAKAKAYYAEWKRTHRDQLNKSALKSYHKCKKKKTG